MLSMIMNAIMAAAEGVMDLQPIAAMGAALGAALIEGVALFAVIVSALAIFIK